MKDAAIIKNKQMQNKLIKSKMFLGGMQTNNCHDERRRG
jgi:hypothetical protein